MDLRGRICDRASGSSTRFLPRTIQNERENS